MDLRISQHPSKTSARRLCHNLRGSENEATQAATNPLESVSSGTVSVGGETVEQTGTAVGREASLAAAARRVCRIPRRISARVNAWTAAGAVMMTKLCATFIVARPVMTGVVVIVRKRPAVRLRACHDVVQVLFVENPA